MTPNRLAGWRPTDRTTDVVYFVASGDAVKIGTTGDLRTRLADMQSGNPVPLRLLGCIPGGRAIEQKLHRRFRALHLSREWFKNTGDLQEFTESIASLKELPYDALDPNGLFLGLLGRNIKRSFYETFAQVIGGQWWRFSTDASPVGYDPIARQSAIRYTHRTRTVCCRLRELASTHDRYRGELDRPALVRFLRALERLETEPNVAVVAERIAVPKSQHEFEQFRGRYA